MKIDSVIVRPKRPKGEGWDKLPPLEAWVTMGYFGERWLYSEIGLMVISAVEVAKNEGEIDIGPEYHISISKVPNSRCTSNEAKFVLRKFDMQNSDEDNHVPGGFVRNFWKPINENLVGHICPCKETETAMKEDKGDFVWRGINK